MSQNSIFKKVFNISPVWIVPIAALIIAGWIGVEAYLEKGARVRISFGEANDIVPGETLIKYKDVEVGMVKDIKLNKSLSGVVVEAAIDRQISGHLSENTKFWVVKPSISAAGVSNLGTIISGVYIVMDPGEKGAYKTNFVGLDRPPLIRSDEEGSPYLLQSNQLGSVNVGSPIYFRKIRVGEVTGFELAENFEYVDINIFIRAPYDKLINTNTNFLNVSGFGFSFGAQGIKANVGSLASIINGGIEFENTAGFSSRKKAEPGHVFYLHPDKESIAERSFNIKYFYLMRFASSVRGLNVGAPIEYKGIKIGEVIDVSLNTEETSDKNLYVYVAIEPQRFDANASTTLEDFDKRLDLMIADGVRGRISTSSLITSAKYIDLIHSEDAEEAFLIRSEGYAEIPTLEEISKQVVEQATSLVGKLNSIPYGEIGKDLASSLTSVKEMLNRLERNKTADKIDTTLSQLEATLASANTAMEEASKSLENLSTTISPDSEIQYELNTMLRSVSQAAQALEKLGDDLAQNPNSLIYGSKNDD